MKSILNLYKGRINKKKFFYGFIVVKIFDLFVYQKTNTELDLLLIIIFIFQVIFGSVLATKRLHDFGFSGWFSVFFLIPVIGFLVGLALLFTKGDIKENNYGPAPK